MAGAREKRLQPAEVGTIALATIAGATITVLLSPTALALVAVGTLVAFTLFRSEATALLLLIALTPATFFGFTYGTSEAVASDVFPVFPFALFFAGAGVIVRSVARIRPQRWETPLDRPVLVLLLWAAASVAWAPNQFHALFQASSLLSNVFLFFFVATLTRSPERFRMAAAAFVVVGIVFAAASIASLHFLEETVVGRIRVEGEFVFEYAVKHSDTRSKALTNPNHTSMLINTANAFLVAFFVTAKRRFARVALAAAILFMIFGVLETKSKAGIGSMLVMLGFLLIAYHRTRRHLFLHASALIGSVILLFVLQTASIGREPRIFASHFSLDARIAMWNQAWSDFMTKSSGGGVGIGGITHYQDPLPHAHNILYSAFLDFGPIGLLILLVMIGKVLLSTGRYTVAQLGRLHAEPIDAFPVAALGAVIAVAVHGLVDFSFLLPTFWLLLALTMNSVRAAAESG